MVTADVTHINPADYFSPDATIPEPPMLTKYFYPVGMPIVGFGGMCYLNYIKRRPLLSSIHMHALFGSLGVIMGIALNNFVMKKAAKNDAIIYQYIISHPEDFPPVERVKYKDVLNVWTAFR